MSHANQRRWNLKGISIQEFNQALEVLEREYGLTWLQTKRDHPLQLLWQRTDELASHELFALGDAIIKISAIDLQWTKAQIKTSKSFDKKNHQGAFFELCGLSFLDSPNHRMRPTQMNQAGYDGILTFREDKKVRVSLKNYGISEAEQRFQNQAKLLEIEIKKLLLKYDYPPTTVVVDSMDHYPEDDDWHLLNDNLNSILQAKRHADDPFYALVTKKDASQEFSPDNHIVNWIVNVAPFKEIDRYHLEYKTYTLIVRSKHHKNEHKNIFDKLSDACFNLTKHSVVESEKLINSVFVHLPASASLEKCYQWIDDYFNEYPDKPITLVMLYQPTVSTEIEKNATFIHHHVRIFMRDERLNLWAPYVPNFAFTFPVGVISQQPSVNTLIMDYPDGQRKTHEMEEAYIYQSGDHYVRMQNKGRNELTVNFQKLGTGLFEHAVLEIPGQPGRAIISGRFAPKDELLIL